MQKLTKDQAESTKSEEFLTLVHYKEPLKPVDSGFGYYGAIQITMDREKIQCHECGGLFANLGIHVWQKHMPVKEYREKYQLAKTTALVSENERARMKQHSIDYFASLSEEEKQEIKAKAIVGMAKFKAGKRQKSPQPKDALETKNKRGTCPDQLLDRIKKLAEKKGGVPSLADLIEDSNGSQRWKHLILATFGSWKNALNMLGMQPKKADFTPNPHRGRGNNYEREELLEYLRIFYEEHGKVPTETDFKRKLLPASSTYRHYFGTIPKARELAGLPSLEQ